MKRTLAVTVWQVSLTWGLLSLLIGFGAALTVELNGSVLPLSAWLLLVFALPIVAVYAARRSPILSGFGLLVAFAAVLEGAVAHIGFGVLPAILRREYVWLHLVFGLAFVIFSRGIRQAFPAPTNYVDEPKWNGRSKVETWMAYRPWKTNR